MEVEIPTLESDDRFMEVEIQTSEPDDGFMEVEFKHRNLMTDLWKSKFKQ